MPVFYFMGSNYLSTGLSKKRSVWHYLSYWTGLSLKVYTKGSVWIEKCYLPSTALGVWGSKPVSKLIFWFRQRDYSVFLFGDDGIGSFFGSRGLNLVLVLDDGGVGITSDNTRVIHKIGAIKSLWLSGLSIFGFLGGDFGFGFEIELSSCIFYHWFECYKLWLEFIVFWIILIDKEMFYFSSKKYQNRSIHQETLGEAI